MAEYNTPSSITQHGITNSSNEINTSACGMKYFSPPPDRKSSHINRIVNVLDVLLVAILCV
jgi:hypothetical protein